MATARKRGNSYRVRKYIYTDEQGKKHYKSFTADRKEDAEQLARDFDGAMTGQSAMRLADAMQQFIDTKHFKSPRTRSTYESIKRNYLKSIQGKNIYKITHEDIQKAINLESMNHSPKTVRNIYSFLRVVMRKYRPRFIINADLPQKIPPKIDVPEDPDVLKLVDAVMGTNLELPVLLAAFGPMRRGEICALRAEDISGNVVHVCRNIVKSNDKSAPWEEKPPKTYAGDRFIDYPDFVRELWEKTGIKSGRLVTICPDTITKKFALILKENNIRHFRFHDLRHYSASIQHALGVPDAYIQQRGGWGDDRTLKEVYRHTMESKEKAQNDRINDYFSDVYAKKYDQKYDHKNEEGR